MAAGNDAASTIKRMFSGSHDTRSKWQYFDAEWDYAICGDFGGHMPEGFDQASEMELVEVGEAVSGALFEGEATAVYSDQDERGRAMTTLIILRISRRDRATAEAAIADL